MAYRFESVRLQSLSNKAIPLSIFQPTINFICSYFVSRIMDDSDDDDDNDDDDNDDDDKI